MKKLLFFFALLFMGAITAFAQVPVNEQLTYQTVVRNAQNQLVFSQNNVSVTVEVCNLDGTTVQYRETHTGLSTNANGLLTLMVGSGTLVSGAWTDIDWSAAAIRTTVTYDSGTGTVSIPSGLAPISAVPYALQAGNANATETDPVFTAWDKSYNDLTNKPTIPDAQVNADWNQDDDTKVDFIKNKPDLTVYATQSGNNTFAGNNSFKGINTVPSVFNIHSTDASNCSNVVVNACDLLAVFDSLNRRFNSVYDSLQRLNDELTALKNSVPPTTTAPSFQNVGSNSMTIKANNTSTGASITSYKYCYSMNEDMSGATCQTASTPTLNVTGLNANTTYYATVEATNLAGSTTSETANVRTPAHAPTANVSGLVAKPAGFKVEVTGIDPKEKTDNTTVQVCYVAKGSGECPDKESANYADCKTVDATGVTDTTISVTGLTPSTAYCAIVKVSNGDSTTIYGPYTVTTGEDVTLTVTRDPSTATVSLCGNPTAAVTFTATPSSGDAGDYTYSWSTGSSATNTNTVALSSGTNTVNVTATHTTESYTVTGTTSVTIASGGTAATLSLCEDWYQSKVTVRSTDCTSLSWVSDATGEEVSTSTTELQGSDAIPAGAYTVKGVNASGCSIEKQVVLGNYNPKPCTAASRGSRDPQVAGTYTPAHGSDGLETVDASGDITSVKDIDNNEYKVVEIGLQCWMAVNLRTTKYADNTSITLGTTSNSSTTVGYYYDYSSGDPNIPLEQRGYLYNWPAAMKSTSNTEGTQGVCPSGWHLPTKTEWQTMVDQADASTSTGAVYLSASCYWKDFNSATDGMTPNSYDNPDRNKSGFSAVPAGTFYGSSFDYSGDYAYFWSSSVDGSRSWLRYLNYSDTYVDEYYDYRYYGFSVRCVRD